MTRIHSSIAVFVLLASGFAYGAEAEYRLAGIIAPDEGKALALIELPDGEQGLFRAGDSIEDGLVAEVTASLVRLEFPQGEVVLQLEGTGEPTVKLPTEYRREDDSGGMPNYVDTYDLRAITQLAEVAEEMDSKKLASKVLTHLNLSPDARIMAIDDQPVESTPDAVRRMAATIEAKSEDESQFQFVVSIAEFTGNSRVYVFADDEGQVTKRTFPAD